jgi:hypothetical protein
MGSVDGQHRDSIAECYACGSSLASRLVEPIETYDRELLNWLTALSISVMSGTRSVRMADTLDVMRQMAVLLTSRFATVKLHPYLCSELVVPEMILTRGHISIETRTLSERHHLVQLIAWLMQDLEPRLRGAWRAKAVRYNHMLKDFERAPASYIKMVQMFSDWRRG